MTLMGAAQERKITYGVLLDNTGSMRSQFHSVNDLGKAVVNQVRGSGPVSLFDSIEVFAVGLVQRLDDESGLIRLSPRAKAIDLLNSVTKETGGRAVFPKYDRIQAEKVLAELAVSSP